MGLPTRVGSKWAVSRITNPLSVQLQWGCQPESAVRALAASPSVSTPTASVFERLGFDTSERFAETVSEISPPC